ncbi:MAG: hypothetical protein COA47_12690 [Robiginitomaculum sp.]|nr:MAG: hypothetical protein COA47_12690 [Robiginitomaculum sp.]
MQSKTQNQADEQPEAEPEVTGQQYSQALELIFVGGLFVIVVAAFLEATTYQLVSSRTPFVAMVPLILLLIIQFIRLLRSGSMDRFKLVLTQARKGSLSTLNKVFGLVCWATLLFVMILIGGHYLGVAVFMFFLMRVLAKERLILTLIIVFSITIILFVLFEYGFDIKLYRGIVHRYFEGYRIF